MLDHSTVPEHVRDEKRLCDWCGIALEDDEGVEEYEGDRVCRQCVHDDLEIAYYQADLMDEW